MKEIYGDIFNILINGKQPDALCIPTNGVVTKDNRLVMGAGIAKEFKLNFENIDKYFGKLVLMNGNIVNYIPKNIYINNMYIFSFPTKNHFKQDSDLKLIEKSAYELMKYITELKDINTCVLPRPGCGCGKLEWEEVKKILSPILDDRIYIISRN